MRSHPTWNGPLAGRRLVARAAVALLVALLAAAAAVAEAQEARWIGTWATGPVSLPAPEESSAAQGNAPPRIADQTVRQVVHTSIGGSQVRVLFSNQYGTEPLEIGGAHIALRDAGAAIAGGSGRRLTFDGEPTAAIERGATLLSDPVDLAVPPLSDLAIDLYLPGDTWETTSPATTHGTGLSTTYLSAPGDHTGAAELPVDSTVLSWFFLSRVEVATRTARGAIVTIGDSITDGTASTPDTNSRWPDFLAARLVAAYGETAPGVLNVGIGGNRVLSHNGGMETILRRGRPFGPDERQPDPDAFFGPSALSRFDRDVLLQPGVTHVIVLESINDVGFAFDNAWPAVEDLIAGHTALVQRAHARGLRIYGGILTPFEGAITFSETGEAKRQAFNAWLRTESPYDAVIDFDAAIRDPDHPRRILPAYDPGDAIHGNDAGYRAMAEAVDLALFDARPVAAAAPAGAAWSPPRTADGHPDLQGVWANNNATPLERPAEWADRARLSDEELAALEAAAAEATDPGRDALFGDQLVLAAIAGEQATSYDPATGNYNQFWIVERDFNNRTSLVVDPPNGRISALAPAAERLMAARAAYRAAHPADTWEDVPLQERCITYGVPRLGAGYNSYYQIFQTADHVVFLMEMNHDARIIPLDGRPQLDAGVRLWHGDSRGRWEGDTLVVETTNYSAKSDFRGASDNLRLVERFTRTGSDTLEYEVTVDDPTTWIRPWTASIPLTRSEDALYEYACHEGNYGMEGILAGHRAQEPSAAAGER